jgi:uncharacterized membrane-anchored protein
MSPRARLTWQVLLLVAVIVGLIFVFPRAFAFVEMAARELRYFWWVILLLALAGWLIWGFKKRP